MLQENIESAGFIADVATDGEEVLDKLEKERYDLYLLDIMMPRLDGISLAKRLRVSDRNTPIIFLTARVMDTDVIAGFEVGADDYVTKPFNINELLWRIRALLRRAVRPVEQEIEQEKELSLGSYSYFPAERLLRSSTTEVRLSKRENEIFGILAAGNGKLIARSDLLLQVWKRHDEHTSNSLDVHLTRIRKLLEDFPEMELTNIHGLGYRLQVG